MNIKLLFNVKTIIPSAEKTNIVIGTLPSTIGWKGETAVIPCDIRGSLLHASWRREQHNSVNVTWTVLRYTNGTTISKDSRYSMDDEFGLVINKLQIADESIFLCEVVGIDGYKLTNSTSLIVNGKGNIDKR